MTTLTLEVDPIVIEVTITDKKLFIELEDGRSIAIPLEWYPRLLYGTKAERQDYQLLGDGYAIEWSQLDEHIGIEGLLAGRRSSESQSSLERWLAKRRGE